MVIIMDICNAAIIREPDEYTEKYDDEVLNAGWLPQPQLALQTVETEQPARPARAAIDPDAFLRAAYLYQE